MPCELIRGIALPGGVLDCAGTLGWWPGALALAVLGAALAVRKGGVRGAASVAFLGLSALASPDAIQVARNALQFDLPVMIAVAIACLPIFFTGYSIDRWEGGLFLSYYAIYTAYLDAGADVIGKEIVEWIKS